MFYRLYNTRLQVTDTHLSARVRRWWYGVNNWKIPGEVTTNIAEKQLAADVESVSLRTVRVPIIGMES